MNARTVSLPDLVVERKKNTALSLSEGFCGASHERTLIATANSFAPRIRGYDGQPPGATGPSSMARTLPLYYRTRQLVLGMEKAGHRVPDRMSTELRQLEMQLAQEDELRSTNLLLFQRFDDAQLSRFLRSMAFLRLSTGRWIFGGDAAEWSKKDGERAFLLLSGRAALFSDPAGLGDRTDVGQGAVFGETLFRLGGETVQARVCAAAKCEEPCVVGCITTSVIEVAFADRAFGNGRIAQMVKGVPALHRVVAPDGAAAKPLHDTHRSTSKGFASEPEGTQDIQESNTVTRALTHMSKIASTLHLNHGVSVLSDEPLAENILVVSRGAIVVRGDVTLVEKLDSIPPRKVRLRLFIDRAEKLAGDSIFDKLDPYCVAKLGDFKRFQTPTLWNVGPNPKFNHAGVLTYSDEPTLEIQIMDHDKFSADDLCGQVQIPISELYDGWSGKVSLMRPKKGIFMSDSTLEEPAGKLWFSVRWDYEKVTELNRNPRRRSWFDQELFHMRDNECWATRA